MAWHVLPSGVAQEVRKRHYYRVLTKGKVAEPEQALLGLFVKPGACVVDVGANFGRYTKTLADLVGPSGRVYSIEPVPETFAILTANVVRMGLGNVIPLRRAVSDADGERVRLVVPKDRPFGLENAYQARIARGPAQGREVTAETCTLDHLLAEETRPVSFVKCDVEGHELVCMRGAMALIERSRPTWLIEVSGDPRAGESSAMSLFHLLGDFGYRAYVAAGKELRPWRPDEGPRVNYFFVPRAVVRSFGAAPMLNG
ncbi:MAG TPA: FkbM family methyltransferase [Gemmatimonadales bacterium]|nr:FkbM family methyltransferase [Gemmatimonadales bacterium]